MNEQTPNHPANTQTFVRRSRFEAEPAAFALALVAVVMAISVWLPQPEVRQAVPADASRTVAQAPSH